MSVYLIVDGHQIIEYLLWSTIATCTCEYILRVIFTGVGAWGRNFPLTNFHPESRSEYHHNDCSI